MQESKVIFSWLVLSLHSGLVSESLQVPGGTFCTTLLWTALRVGASGEATSTLAFGTLHFSHLAITPSKPAVSSSFSRQQDQLAL